MNPHLAILEKARAMGAIRTHEWRPLPTDTKAQFNWKTARAWLLRHRPEAFTQGWVAKRAGVHTDCVKRAMQALEREGLIRKTEVTELLTGNRLAPVLGGV